VAVLACACESAVRTRTTATIGHYAANGNFDASGTYLPASSGFTIADVGSRAQLDGLPRGTTGMVYLGSCGGDSPQFRSQVTPFAGSRNLFGFFIIDEPDPATCPASRLAAESAYIHRQLPGARTFITEQNLSGSGTPSYRGGYDRSNTGIDLFGLDPYPCRSELRGCDYAMIDRYVAAAERAGLQRDAIIPVFQAFGGGEWVDDAGGRYQLPTPAQAARIMLGWAQLVPNPVFDVVYSWGVQRNDVALGDASGALRQAFLAHNRSG
jgi:hypothetical protein